MSVYSCGLIILLCMTLGCLPAKLDYVWEQLEEKVIARRNGLLTDEEFIEWNTDSFLKVLPSRKERRISMVGLPPIIVDLEKETLSSCAYNGQWVDIIANSWGKAKGEAYAYWGDEVIDNVIAASRKECILLALLADVWPEDGTSRGDNEIIIYDIAVRVRPLSWVFIYGENALLYPNTPKLNTLFIPYSTNSE